MPAKLKFEFVKQSFDEQGYTLCSKEYTHSNEKLVCICPKGHQYSVSWLTWYTGKRCPFCASNARLTVEFVTNELLREGYVFLNDNYVNNRTKFKYCCPKGHTNFMTWNSWRKGIRCVTCSNIEMSLRVIGEKHPNWKGGISCEPYCKDWTKLLKEFIKERDGYKCLNPYCLRVTNRLCVHHIDYNKKNCKINNLITICSSCNVMANKDRLWHQAWYESIINRRYSDRPLQYN